MIEYRIVCSGVPPSLHRLHRYAKPTLERARMAAAKNNDEEPPVDLPTFRCAPWRVQSREVGEWEEAL